jgi:hypothetical protein
MMTDRSLVGAEGFRTAFANVDYSVDPNPSNEGPELSLGPSGVDEFIACGEPPSNTQIV